MNSVSPTEQVVRDAVVRRSEASNVSQELFWLRAVVETERPVMRDGDETVIPLAETVLGYRKLSNFARSGKLASKKCAAIRN